MTRFDAWLLGILLVLIAIYAEISWP